MIEVEHLFFFLFIYLFFIYLLFFWAGAASVNSLKMKTVAILSLFLLVTCRAAEHQRLARQVAPSMFGVGPGGFAGGAPIGRQIPGAQGFPQGGFGQQPGGFGAQPGFGPIGKRIKKMDENMEPYFT